MGLGGNTGFKGQLDSAQHSVLAHPPDGLRCLILLIMVQNQGEYLHHLPVTARALQQVALQLSERWRKLDERRAITQCTGLALDHRQVLSTASCRGHDKPRASASHR